MEKSLVGENSLFSDVCGIIDNSRKRVAVYVNSEICLVKWHVGKRIREDVLYNQRAEYGKQIVKNLSVKLTNKYGSGWSYESLKHCLRVANIFTEEEIGYAVRIQFSWTHIRSLSALTDPLARQFYMEMCRIEHWDTRTLDAKIDSQLYERTAISRKPEELIKQELDNLKVDNMLSPDLVFRSSYFGYPLNNRLIKNMKKYTNNDVYKILSEEIKVTQVMHSMTVEELRAKESDVDFWEELSEHIDFFRICDACHKPMIEGYCIDDGAEHYCSRECLHTQMTDEEFEELSDEDGTSYFTNWYEDSRVMGAHTEMGK